MYKLNWEHRRCSGTFTFYLTSCNMSMFRNALSVTPGGQRVRSFHSDDSRYSIYSALAYIQVLENVPYLLKKLPHLFVAIKRPGWKGKIRS